MQVSLHILSPSKWLQFLFVGSLPNSALSPHTDDLKEASTPASLKEKLSQARASPILLAFPKNISLKALQPFDSSSFFLCPGTLHTVLWFLLFIMRDKWILLHLKMESVPSQKLELVYTKTVMLYGSFVMGVSNGTVGISCTDKTLRVHRY